MTETREQLGVSFSDFWRGFVPEESIFWSLLSEHYELALVPDGQLHLFSSYGDAHLRHAGRKVFFSAENEIPPRLGCDFAIGQLKATRQHYHYFPLWLLYHFRATLERCPLPPRPPERRAWLRREDICSVVSNTRSRERNAVLDQLSRALRVAHGGRALNNVGGPVADKHAFVEGFRFHLAMENSIGNGYVTEKIYEAFGASSIPVYWGDEAVFDFFNPEAFVYLDRSDLSRSIARVVELVGDSEGAYAMTRAPVFRIGFDPDDYFRRLEEVLVENAGLSRIEQRRRARLRTGIASFEFKLRTMRYYGDKVARRTFR